MRIERLGVFGNEAFVDRIAAKQHAGITHDIATTGVILVLAHGIVGKIVRRDTIGKIMLPNAGIFLFNPSFFLNHPILSLLLNVCVADLDFIY